jgi:hypothetical protein
LKHKGFGDKWIGWVRDILGSGTSSVFLNRVPSKVFHCRRRVRQGDPLSPLLFVLAADLLQTLINRAKDQGQINLPIPKRAGLDFFPYSYDDDILLVMEACPRQLMVLKDLLHSFSVSNRLKVNHNKLVMMPLNISEDKLDELSRVFDWQKGTFTFTYLGLPLGISKPNMH